MKQSVLPIRGTGRAMEGAHGSRFSGEASRDPRPDHKRKGVFQDYLRGRKSLISPRVISSGKDPPVFSNRDLRKAPSSGVGLVSTYAPGNDRYQSQIFIIRMGHIPIPNRSATPGRCQTGSTANFVTASSPDSLRHIFLSGTIRPSRTLCSSSGNLICWIASLLALFVWGHSSNPEIYFEIKS